MGVWTISDYIYRVKLQKNSPKWAGIGISQPNRQSRKIAIYRLPMKIFATNFIDRLSTGGTLEKCEITSNRNVKGSRGLLLKLWDPFHISGTIEAINFKFGIHIDHEGH